MNVLCRAGRPGRRSHRTLPVACLALMARVSARADVAISAIPTSDWYWLVGLVTAIIAMAVILSYFIGLNRRLQRLTANAQTQLSDRQRVDEALEASEAFYHSLVQNLPLKIIRKDTDGRFTFGNPQFCEEIKIPLEQLRGKTDFELFPAPLAEKYRADDRRVMQTGEPFEATEAHLGDGGSRQCVRVIKTPIRDGSDKVIGLQAIFWDVTLQTEAEEALQKNEARTRLIIDTANDAFVEINAGGKITAWNPAAVQVFGWTAEQIMGRGLDETIIPPQYRSSHLAGLAKFFQTGEGPVLNRRFEITALHRSGLEFPIEVTISPIKLGDQFRFAAFIHDITNRKRREEELRLSRERFDLAVQGSNDGIWDWNIRSNAVYFSPRWKEIIGYLDDQIENQFEEWRKRIHPDDLNRAMGTVDDYLKRRTASYELEHRLLHKDNTYRWILARGVAIWDADGTPQRMAGSLTDITDRKEAERSLLQQEKLAALGQMVAGVAHEINNPLAFVSNNVAVVQRDVSSLRDLILTYAQADPIIAAANPDLAGQLSQKAARFDLTYTLGNLDELFARSRDGLKRIQQIVKDLRDFARLDSSDMQEVDLNEGITSTVNIVRGLARKKQITVETHAGTIPRITCYPAKINQVILNLVANAIDACGDNGRVVVTSRRNGDFVEIEVTDNGTGIEPAIREKIFDPFFTTKPIGVGTGLGLSISYGIIQNHQGTIRLESELGCGSSFTICLPIGESR